MKNILNKIIENEKKDKEEKKIIELSKYYSDIDELLNDFDSVLNSIKYIKKIFIKNNKEKDFYKYVEDKIKEKIDNFKK